jgi:hypothetical protein
MAELFNKIRKKEIMSQQEITIEISENNLEQLRAIELTEADNKKIERFQINLEIEKLESKISELQTALENIGE